MIFYQDKDWIARNGVYVKKIVYPYHIPCINSDISLPGNFLRCAGCGQNVPSKIKTYLKLINYGSSPKQ